MSGSDFVRRGAVGGAFLWFVVIALSVCEVIATRLGRGRVARAFAEYRSDAIISAGYVSAAVGLIAVAALLMGER